MDNRHLVTRKLERVDELEDDTHSDVKDIDLEDVIETDKDSGKPALHQSVEITVEPRAQRKWIK
jgi:hypothetical protein